MAGRSGSANRAAHFGRTGECDFVDVRMIDQRLSGSPISRYDVYDTMRQASLLAKLGKASAVSGVNSAGFNTTVFPAASAGAIFHASMSSGKFQGMICPTTPQGSCSGNSWSRS